MSVDGRNAIPLILMTFNLQISLTYSIPVIGVSAICTPMFTCVNFCIANLIIQMKYKILGKTVNQLNKGQPKCTVHSSPFEYVTKMGKYRLFQYSSEMSSKQAIFSIVIFLIRVLKKKRNIICMQKSAGG